MPLKIIVNADDLGISEEVNDAIFQAMSKGFVTSTTVLSNGRAMKGSLKNLSLLPRCSIGIHLNLSEFQPLCRESRRGLASIIDENGHFNGNAIREVKIGVPMMRAIFQEWCSQIENLAAMGVEISHLDSHHHVHTIPRLLPVLVALRRRYGISKVRISRNLYQGSERPSPYLAAGKRLYNLALRSAGYRTTDMFTDLGTFLKVHAASSPQFKSIELMTHPGSLTDTHEAALLRTDWRCALKYDVNAINYKKL
jgi:chitin disaccharide deacetylase